MTPAARFFRHLLFLPVKEAEAREKEAFEASKEIRKTRQKFKSTKEKMLDRAADLREAYDELLGRMEK